MRVSLGCYSFNRKLSNDWRVVNLSLALTNGTGQAWHQKIPPDEYKHVTNDMLYSLIRPIAPKLYFENGNEVPQHIAILFVPRNIRNINSKF